LGLSLPVYSGGVDAIDQGAESEFDFLFEKVKLFFGGTSHTAGLYGELKLGYSADLSTTCSTITSCLARFLANRKRKIKLN
jgi:hypothetical protein